MIKKILSCMVCCALISVAATGCGKKELNLSENDSDDNNASESTLDYANFTPPVEGEEIVVLTIKDYGEIKIKLFEEESPMGSQNFKGLVNQGYYDELIFHRVIEDFMIQGGDPKGNGTGGESMWGGKFDGGAPENLYHFAGAVAYANSGSTSTNGSQFYIVTGSEQTDESLEYYQSDEYQQLMTANGASYTIPDYSEEVIEKYKEVGGVPYLDGGYTVFGQVIDGLDIVYEISQISTDSKNKPFDAVVIESAKIVEYDGSEIDWYK